MKKGVAVLFVFLILVSFIGNFVFATEEQIVQKNPGLFGAVKEVFFGAFDFVKEIPPVRYVQDKTLWILGAKTFEGESISLLDPLGYITGSGWKYFLFMLVIVFWVWIFKIILDPRGHGRNGDLFDRIVENTLDFFESWVKILLMMFIFLFLLGIPIINRILQIITLEALGVHWFWRSLIIAVVFSFWNPLLKAYRASVKRKRYYANALEEQAIKEVGRAELYE